MKLNNVNEYAKKFIFANEAIKFVLSGAIIRYACGGCCTTALDMALAQRKNELKNIHIYSDPNYRHFQAANSSTRGENFLRQNPRRKQKSTHDGDIRQHIDRFGNGKPCTPQFIFMAMVSPMDKDGRFWSAPGLSLEKYRNDIQMARYIIVEINEKIPWIQEFSNFIHISEVDYVLLGQNPPLVNIGHQRSWTLIG